MTPRAFPPPPGWSPDGHRLTVPLDYGRGPAKTWGYGALRVCDGQALTLTAPAPNTAGSLALLQAAAPANPAGERSLITATLARQKSPPIQAWRAAHPRVQPVFLPTGACWLTLIEAWWRLLRREAGAGQRCADSHASAEGTRAATGRLTGRATPWVWGRPRRPQRRLRRRFGYHL